MQKNYIFNSNHLTNLACLAQTLLPITTIVISVVKSIIISLIITLLISFVLKVINGLLYQQTTKQTTADTKSSSAKSSKTAALLRRWRLLLYNHRLRRRSVLLVLLRRRAVAAAVRTRSVSRGRRAISLWRGRSVALRGWRSVASIRTCARGAGEAAGRGVLRVASLVSQLGADEATGETAQ